MRTATKKTAKKRVGKSTARKARADFSDSAVDAVFNANTTSLAH